MRITKITVCNINSLKGNFSLDFNSAPLGNAGIFAITGDTGAGKTTLLDAMTLALYGRVHRNKENAEVMSFGTADSLAEVEFEVNQQRYRAKWAIRRAKGRIDGNLQTPLREVSKFNSDTHEYQILNQKIKEADEKIAEITGLDFDRFCRSVLLAQGSFAAFLHADERERSDLLERMTGTDIYSQLSVAAHQKAKEEWEEVTKLQNQIANIPLSDPETRMAMETRLTQLQESLKPLNANLEHHKLLLEWRRNLDQQLHTLAELHAQDANHRMMEAQEKENFQKLELHQRASKHGIRLNDLNTHENLGINYEAQKQKLLSDLTENFHALELNQTKLSQQAKLVEELEDTFTKRKPIYEQCIYLDSNLQDKNQQLHTSQQELDRDQDDLNHKEQQISLLENKRTLEKEKISTLENWKKNNEQAGTLEVNLDNIKNSYKLYLSKKQEIKNIEKILSENRIQKQSADSKLSEEEVRSASLTQEIERIALEISALPGEEASSDVSSRMLRESTRLEALRKRLENVTRQIDLSEKIKDLNKKISGNQTRLESLRNEQSALQGEMLSAEKELKEAKILEIYKKKVYQDQLQSASYETARGNLPVGEPCPLCFSIHHPFREMDLEIFVDTAKQELEEAEARHQQIQEQLQQLKQRENALREAIAQIAGTDPVLIGGELAGQYDALANLEKEISGLQQQISADGQLSRIDDLATEVAQLTETIKSGEAVLQQITNLYAKQQGLKESLENSRRSLDQLRKEQHNLQNQLIAEETRLQAEKNAEQQLEITLKNLLAIYGFEFQAVNFQDVYRKLESLFSTWKKANDELESYREKLTQTNTELDKLQGAISSLKPAIEQKKGTLQELRQAIFKLEAERKSLPVGQNPRHEKEAEETTLNHAKAYLQDVRNRRIEMETTCKNLQPQLQQTENDLNKTLEKVAALRDELERAASEDGFAHLEALKQALLESETVQRIEARKTELSESGHRIRGAMEKTLAQVEELRARALSEKSADELNEEYQKIQQELVTQNQAIGALNNQLEAARNNAQQAQILIEKLNEQMQEYQRWEELDKLIGSSDGKAFRVFAQGLTLQQLTQLANRHLEQLSGRYQLKRRSWEKLELEILDTFQADHRRSVKTLSGGESFLVSLALALALSDMAGQNTSIQSLFIDEGFGTLDENSLDIALNTLENLQGSGKTIGIISHVKELKERVGVQIFVRKGGNGFSTIELKG